MTNANWRITFPIQKSEYRADGFYIVGEASGPELDAEGERMHPELIYRFADQISELAAAGTPLVWRDAHAPDGVLRDLGEVTRAWVTPEMHLGVEVRLDEDHPATNYLMKKLAKGKQYGMSVAGKVLDFADEFVAELGQVVRTYKNVVLTEISITTRPAWTPSFGSVLSKAIDDAAEAESLQGVALMENEELAQETTTEASADETTKAAEEAVEETDPETAAEETTEEAEKSDSTESESDEDDDVEKAGRKFSAAAASKLLGMYAEIGETLKELGLLEDDAASNEPAEKADSEDSGETIDKSGEESADEVTQLRQQVEELVRSNTELTAKVQELESRAPTVVPPVIKGDEEKVEDFRKAMSELDPAARLRVAFAAATGGK